MILEKEKNKNKKLSHIQGFYIGKMFSTLQAHLYEKELAV